MTMRILNVVLAALPVVATLEDAKALPPVDWAKADCVEGSMFMSGFTCGEEAASLMYSPRDKRAYTMCFMCASHNLRRGMVVVQHAPSAEEQGNGED